MVEDPERGARYAAVVGIVGALNIPIVHFSVNWWRTLHQPSTILGPEPSPIAPPILAALARQRRRLGAPLRSTSSRAAWRSPGSRSARDRAGKRSMT